MPVAPARRLVGRSIPGPIRRAIGGVIRRRRRLGVRRFELRLPVPPPLAAVTTGSTTTRPDRALARLRIEAPRWMRVPRALEMHGLAGFQPDAMAVFLAAVERFADRPVFDIGANVGIFSMAASACVGARVTGFEPTPGIAQRFVALAEINRLRCDIEMMALGERTGSALLHLSDLSDSSNSLRAGFRPASRSVEVRVERLDDYCARTGLRPGVMKVDTESTEPDVLRGGLAVLGRDRPWIVCEVLAGRTEVDLEAILDPLGYRWYALGGVGVVTPAAELRGDVTHQQLDWLFVPGQLPDDFVPRARAWRSAIDACLPT